MANLASFTGLLSLDSVQGDYPAFLLAAAQDRDSELIRSNDQAWEKEEETGSLFLGMIFPPPVLIISPPMSLLASPRCH